MFYMLCYSYVYDCIICVYIYIYVCVYNKVFLILGLSVLLITTPGHLDHGRLTGQIGEGRLVLDGSCK